MRTIEEGVDINGNPCWFVLEDADLIGIYNTYQEAENNL